jgi:hypothetical protein
LRDDTTEACLAIRFGRSELLEVFFKESDWFRITRKIGKLDLSSFPPSSDLLLEHVVFQRLLNSTWMDDILNFFKINFSFEVIFFCKLESLINPKLFLLGAAVLGWKSITSFCKFEPRSGECVIYAGSTK